MSREVRIAAVGEVTEDVYLPDEERHLGGISANFARAARWAGADAVLYASVGDDARGARVRAALADLRLDARVRTDAGVTTSARLRIAEGGERLFCGFEAGVGASYRLLPEEIAELAAYDAIAVPCAPESASIFAQLVGLDALRGKLVADFSQDSAPDEPGRPERWIAPHAALLGAAYVGGTPAFLAPLQALSRASGLLIVLTAGAAGAWALSRGDTVHQPALATDIVDTTGCGDAFAGASTAARLRGATLAESLRIGAECAAVVAAARGAGAPPRAG